MPKRDSKSEFSPSPYCCIVRVVYIGRAAWGPGLEYPGTLQVRIKGHWQSSRGNLAQHQPTLCLDVDSLPKTRVRAHKYGEITPIICHGLKQSSLLPLPK